MTREEYRQRRRRCLVLLLAALLTLLCLTMSQCGGSSEPGVVATAIAMQ